MPTQQQEEPESQQQALQANAIATTAGEKRATRDRGKQKSSQIIAHKFYIETGNF